MTDESKGPWGSSGSDSGNDSKDSPRKEKDNGGPWGGGSFQGRNQNNKKIEETLLKMQQQFKESFGTRGRGPGGSKFSGSGGGPKRSTIIGFITGAALLWLGTGFFIVKENETAVVLRFGEMVRHVSAGLQYHIPYPIESVIIQDATFHVFSESAKKDEGSESTPAMILTGDENMVICNYRVRWQIKDVVDFLFTARHPETTIRAAAESVVREVIGNTTAQVALTTEQAEIAMKVQTALQKLMDQYKLGVTIVEFNLQSVNPPAEVVAAFNDLQASKTDAGREVNKAEAYRNDILPRARGAAVQYIRESEGERDAKIAVAQGEANRYKQVYQSYLRNKSLAIKRVYMDAMREVFERTKIVILDPKTGQGVVPLYPLNESKKLLEKKVPEQAQGAQK